jgi:ABC-2 type transport system ATP-binding protein
MIRLRNLRVDYDDLCAVRDLSLELGAGEVCGLIGPNGAGKTTTMRAMLGLIEPTYGEVELAGVDIRERPQDACRVVGFMPDFPPLYDDLLCWEFLDLFAASYAIPKARRRDLVELHLERVGLTEKRNTLAVELSRGMRQRLMLAKTLLPEPQVLLLDEPASGMDPQGRINLKNILKQLGSEGKTVLVSSHILAEMTEFCTSVAIMERGRMVVSGTIDEVNAQVMGASIIVVEVVNPDDELQSQLATKPFVARPVKRDGELFEFPFQGDREQTSELLADLIRSGVKVVSFSRRRQGLEELFLKVGAKELS